MKATWLYQANWLRGGECLVDAGQIRYVTKPTDTFIGYNTFDYFYPGGRGPMNQQSLYLEFANLSERPDDIVRFLEKHGPLHLIGLLGGTIRPTPTPDHIKGVVDARDTLRTCLSLGQAIEKQDSTLLRKVEWRVSVPHHRRWQHITPPDNLRRAEEKFQTILFRHLQGMTPMVFRDHSSKLWGSRWAPPSLLSVFYLMLYLDLQGSSWYRQCPLDDYGCGRVFMAERERAKYCSKRCQELAKVRRMRAK